MILVRKQQRALFCPAPGAACLAWPSCLIWQEFFHMLSLAFLKLLQRKGCFQALLCL